MDSLFPNSFQSIITAVKQLGLVAWFVVLTAAPVQAADSSVEEKVKTIRVRYAEIERGLKDCRQVKRDLPGESAEGGEMTAYFKDSSVRKLSAKFLGETGKALEEYYFWNSELIFVLRVESHYTKPMSGVVKTKTEDRFYFADGKLIQWLGVDKKPREMDAEAEKRGRELLASAKKYSAMASQ
jgi:hypothetical protein